jgi:hypothetical protein
VGTFRRGTKSGDAGAADKSGTGIAGYSTSLRLDHGKVLTSASGTPALVGEAH